MCGTVRRCHRRAMPVGRRYGRRGGPARRVRGPVRRHAGPGSWTRGSRARDAVPAREVSGAYGAACVVRSRCFQEREVVLACGDLVAECADVVARPVFAGPSVVLFGHCSGLSSGVQGQLDWCQVVAVDGVEPSTAGIRHRQGVTEWHRPDRFGTFQRLAMIPVGICKPICRSVRKTRDVVGCGPSEILTPSPGRKVRNVITLSQGCQSCNSSGFPSTIPRSVRPGSYTIRHAFRPEQANTLAEWR